MFSIKESILYGWEKFKQNLSLSLLATLLLVCMSSLLIDKNIDFSAFMFNVGLTVFILIIRIGYTKVFLRIQEGEKPDFTDIFKEYSIFWQYLGVSILVPLAILGGLILLIVPGIIWAVRFSFSPIILIDKKIGPVLAMKESYAMTKGMFWKLVLFWITMGLLNLGGLLLFGLGILISMPVSTLATMYVYKLISGRILPTPASLTTNSLSI